jgi:carbon-monoxide dehydrogenase medium subunit
MARVREYHQPETVAETLNLLARSGVVSVPLAGGTTLVPRLVQADNEVEAIVDLGRLVLDYIAFEGDLLRLGAVVRLSDVVDSPVCSKVAGGLLSRAARLNAVVNVRNAATVGGVVVEGEPTSELLLALLALDAAIAIQSAADEPRSLPVDAFLRAPADALAQGLLTEVHFSVPQGHVGSGLARLGRTPRDRPIVAAAALVTRQDDVAAHVSLALSGVAEKPVRLGTVGDALEGQSLTTEVLDGALDGLVEQLAPPDDFRGSAEYRQAMAPILARRALQEAWAMTMD